jgi:putative DNA primase/helicase
MARPADNLRLPLTDVGNAERLRRAWRQTLIFVPGMGWGFWTGAHWDFGDGVEERALERAKQLSALLRLEARAAERREFTEGDLARAVEREAAKKRPRFATPEEAAPILRQEQATARRDFAEQCGNEGRIRSALRLLKPLVQTPREELDADPAKLAARNGVLDLARVEAEERDPPEAEDVEERTARRRRWLALHDPWLRNTRTLGVHFDPEAECPRFDAFLELIQPDVAMRGYLLLLISTQN